MTAKGSKRSSDENTQEKLALFETRRSALRTKLPFDLTQTSAATGPELTLEVNAAKVRFEPFLHGLVTRRTSALQILAKATSRIEGGYICFLENGSGVSGIFSGSHVTAGTLLSRASRQRHSLTEASETCSVTGVYKPSVPQRPDPPCKRNVRRRTGK